MEFVSKDETIMVNISRVDYVVVNDRGYFVKIGNSFLGIDKATYDKLHGILRMMAEPKWTMPESSGVVFNDLKG